MATATGNPTARNETNQRPAISANSAAATSAGAGVPAGATNETSEAAQNGNVG